MDQDLYRFRAIIGHQGPLLASDPDWKGSTRRLGRLSLNPSLSLLLMIQSHVQHMPKRMTYLIWRDGVDSEALPRRIRSFQEQSSKVRSGNSGDLKHICLDISSPETTFRPCNLTLKTRIANGMMPLSLNWNPCQNTKYSKSGIKQSLINIRKSKTLLKIIIGFNLVFSVKFDGRH